jgi:hypothetical protein
MAALSQISCDPILNRGGQADENFLIVSIGSSAGGVQPGVRLLREAPADTGLAIVSITSGEALQCCQKSLHGVLSTSNRKTSVKECASLRFLVFGDPLIRARL